MRKIFKIEIDCALCAKKCEEAISKLDEVVFCNINFMTQKMILEIKNDDFNSILKKALKVAKKIEPDFYIEIN
ncbi:MAG: cation transporter [Anaeroplasmataceae bacterium]